MSKLNWTCGDEWTAEANGIPYEIKLHEYNYELWIKLPNEDMVHDSTHFLSQDGVRTLMGVAQSHADLVQSAIDNSLKGEFQLQQEQAEALTKAGARIAELLEENSKLRDAVIVAHDVFAGYANLHAEKRTPEGNGKSKANRAYADQMAVALGMQP